MRLMINVCLGLLSMVTVGCHLAGSGAPKPIDLASGNYATRTLHDEADLAPLIPENRFKRVIRLDESQADATYVYRVTARCVDAGPSNMRIQAVWLPEGGWDATDATGQSLTRVELKRVQPAAEAEETWELQFKRPPQAVELRIFLHNEGVGGITVSHVSVIEATPIEQEVTAG
jgi:hypothetical protein